MDAINRAGGMGVFMGMDGMHGCRASSESKGLSAVISFQTRGPLHFTAELRYDYRTEYKWSTSGVHVHSIDSMDSMNSMGHDRKGLFRRKDTSV